MKQLLNTLYVTTQGAYLAKDGEAVAVRVEQETRLRVPIHTLGSIVCFGQVSCSPFLMGLCGENNVALAFLSENGKFLARVHGPVSGNVLLRRQQYRSSDCDKSSASMARSVVLGKVANCRTVLLRGLREKSDSQTAERLEPACLKLARLLDSVAGGTSVDEIRGYEGDAARIYFSAFDDLITASRDDFFFRGRNRRPPLDNVNALLSFVYTLVAHDIVAALESVGLDPAVGFLHRDRPGRPSLALDLLEELRPVIADRLVLSLINRRQVHPDGFSKTDVGGVTMDDETRKLGRALDEFEIEALLDRYGSPMTVASRFRSRRRLSIGVELVSPELFPAFITVLVLNLLIVVMVFATMVVLGKWAEWQRFLIHLAVQLGGVTAVFAILQVAHRKTGFLDRWKPASVPPRELLDRYLHALRFWLPAAQQDEIVAEVAEDLRSAIEDKETDLGRPLQPDEVAGIIKRRGEPMRVASAYEPRQLVGPELLPAYWFLLRTTVLWILFPLHLVITGPLALRSGEPAAIVHTLWSFVMWSLFSVGAITVAFAVMQRRPHKARDWDPRKLQPVSSSVGISQAPPSRAAAIAEILSSLMFSALWIYVMRSAPAVPIGDVAISAAPVWHSLFWPILAVLSSGIPAGVAVLLRPARTRLRSIVRLGSDGLSLILVLTLLRVDRWVEISGTGLRPDVVVRIGDAIHQGMWIALLFVAMVLLLDAFLEITKLRRSAVRTSHAVIGARF